MDQVASAPSRVEARREQTRELILSAAWQVAGAAGLEALSLREIGAAVGMRAPSLYSYFPSKAAILDALFADGYRALERRITEVADGLPVEASPRERLAALLGSWMAFCQEDRARYQLLFTVAVPGWTPSPAPTRPVVASFDRAGEYLALAGITSRRGHRPLHRAIRRTGRAADGERPRGDRWVRRIEEVVDMLLWHTMAREARAKPTPRRTP